MGEEHYIIPESNRLQISINDTSEEQVDNTSNDVSSINISNIPINSSHAKYVDLAVTPKKVTVDQYFGNTFYTTITHESETKYPCNDLVYIIHNTWDASDYKKQGPARYQYNGYIDTLYFLEIPDDFKYKTSYDYQKCNIIDVDTLPDYSKVTLNDYNTTIYRCNSIFYVHWPNYNWISLTKYSELYGDSIHLPSLYVYRYTESDTNFMKYTPDILYSNNITLKKIDNWDGYGIDAQSFTGFNMYTWGSESTLDLYSNKHFATSLSKVQGYFKGDGLYFCNFSTSPDDDGFISSSIFYIRADTNSSTRILFDIVSEGLCRYKDDDGNWQDINVSYTKKIYNINDDIIYANIIDLPNTYSSIYDFLKESQDLNMKCICYGTYFTLDDSVKEYYKKRVNAFPIDISYEYYIGGGTSKIFLSTGEKYYNNPATFLHIPINQPILHKNHFDFAFEPVTYPIWSINKPWKIYHNISVSSKEYTCKPLNMKIYCPLAEINDKTHGRGLFAVKTHINMDERFLINGIFDVSKINWISSSGEKINAIKNPKFNKLDKFTYVLYMYYPISSYSDSVCVEIKIYIKETDTRIPGDVDIWWWNYSDYPDCKTIAEIGYCGAYIEFKDFYFGLSETTVDDAEMTFKFNNIVNDRYSYSNNSSELKINCKLSFSKSYSDLRTIYIYPFCSDNDIINAPIDTTIGEIIFNDQLICKNIAIYELDEEWLGISDWTAFNSALSDFCTSSYSMDKCDEFTQNCVTITLDNSQLSGCKFDISTRSNHGDTPVNISMDTINDNNLTGSYMLSTDDTSLWAISYIYVQWTNGSSDEKCAVYVNGVYKETLSYAYGNVVTLLSASDFSTGALSVKLEPYEESEDDS